MYYRNAASSSWCSKGIISYGWNEGVLLIEEKGNWLYTFYDVPHTVYEEFITLADPMPAFAAYQEKYRFDKRGLFDGDGAGI